MIFRRYEEFPMSKPTSPLPGLAVDAALTATGLGPVVTLVTFQAAVISAMMPTPFRHTSAMDRVSTVARPLVPGPIDLASGAVHSLRS